MSRRTLLERYNAQLNDDIDAKEAYTDKGSLRTIIKGKRDVGVIDLNKDFIPKLEKYKLGVLPLRMTSHHTILSIIYRNREKAFRLYDIARSKGGYLKDDTPNEAREIGKLLGYTDESINDYIRRKYQKNIPLRTDTEDDYDYLSEQKQIVKLNKKLIGTTKDSKGNRIKICSVNGSYVKAKKPSGLGFIEFVEGGHHYVDSYPEYKKYIPEDEIWIDEVFLHKPDDFRAIVGHEWLERNLMKYENWTYSKAHEYANKKEMKVRERSQKENLQENTEIKHTLNLMKKLRFFVYFLFFHWFFL